MNKKRNKISWPFLIAWFAGWFFTTIAHNPTYDVLFYGGFFLYVVASSLYVRYIKEQPLNPGFTMSGIMMGWLATQAGWKFLGAEGKSSAWIPTLGGIIAIVVHVCANRSYWSQIITAFRGKPQPRPDTADYEQYYR